MSQLEFLLLCLAGWIDGSQQHVIEYLQEEVRVLKEQLGRQPRFNEDRRRRFAAKAEKLSGQRLREFATLVNPRTLLGGITGSLPAITMAAAYALPIDRPA